MKFNICLVFFTIINMITAQSYHMGGPHYGIGATFTYEMDDENITFKYTGWSEEWYSAGNVPLTFISPFPANYVNYFEFSNSRPNPYYLSDGKIVFQTWRDGEAYDIKTIENPGSIRSRFYQSQFSTYDKLMVNNGEERPFYYIPDTFWDNNDYAIFSIHYKPLTDIDLPSPSGSSISQYINTTHNYPTNYVNWEPNYQFGRIDLIIYPFIDADGVKRTLRDNDGPVIKFFGPQAGYRNSRSSFISFAQDKEGDLLVYRWANPVDNHRFYDPNTPYQNLKFRDVNEGGPYSATSPLYPNTNNTDYFYINPYSGYIDYYHNENRIGFRRNTVAIDQYHEGQLVSTIHYEVPFYSEPLESSNNFPVITFSSNNQIGQKSTFNYTNDNPTGHIPNFGPKTHGYLWQTDNLFPYTDSPNNNGEVLLDAINVAENETVTLNISYSDPDNNTVTLDHIPVHTNLYDTHPATFSDDENGNATWTWTSPSDLSAFTGLNSKPFMFMFYGQDNAGVLPQVPGRTLKPFSITVHKQPSLVISSPEMESGDKNSYSTIELNFQITGVDDDEVLSFTDPLTADDFNIFNAELNDFTQLSNTTYRATLTPTLDPTTQIVDINIILENEKFSINKLGGHNINSIELSNSASNTFLWTTNQEPLIVSYEFYSSTGSLIQNNSTTNDPYIVAKIQTSHPTNDFTLEDVSISFSSGSFQKEFTQVDSQNYFVKLLKSESSPTSGFININIGPNKFKNEFGNNNLTGTHTQSNQNTFTWNFDYFIRQISIEDQGQQDGYYNILVSQGGGLTEHLFFNIDTIPVALNTLNTDQLQSLENELNFSVTNGYIDDIELFPSDETYRVFGAKLYPNSPNSNVTVTLTNGFFTDIAGNLTNETSKSFSYNNSSLPWLTNFYKIEDNQPGQILSNLTETTTHAIVGFAGQASQDRGYNSSDSEALSIFNISGQDFITSPNSEITSLNYFGIGETKIIDEQSVTEQLFEVEITLTQPGDVVIELPENSFTNSSSVSNIRAVRTFTNDLIPPTIIYAAVKPNGNDLQNNNISSDTYIVLLATASEPISGFSIDDIIFDDQNGNTGILSDFIVKSNTVFEVKLTPQNDGDYIVYTENNEYVDRAGLENETSSDPFIWTYDASNPTATIDVFDGEHNLTQNESTPSMLLTATYQFSEKVFFEGNLIDLLNANTFNASIIEASFNDQSTTITATVSVPNPGLASLSLAEGSFYDILNKNNLVVPDVKWISNPEVPEVNIKIYDEEGNLIPDGGKTNATELTIHYDVNNELDENYSTYTLEQLQDILNTQIDQASLTNLYVNNNSLIGSISNLAQGIINFNFPANLINAMGLPNAHAIPMRIDVDNILPSAIFQIEGNSEPIENEDLIKSETATLIITTSEAVNDLFESDLYITGPATISNFAKVNSTTYEVALLHSSGDVTISLGSNTYSDAYSNFNATSNTISYSVDLISPTVDFTLWYETGTTTAPITGGETLPINEFYAQVNFSEDVTLISINDVVSNFLESLSDNTSLIAEDINLASSTTLILKVSATNGTVNFTVPENIAFDQVGHSNLAAPNTLSFDVFNAATLNKVEWSTNTGNEGTRVAPAASELFGLIQNGHLPKQLYAKEGTEIRLTITADQPIEEPVVYFKINGNSIPNTISYDMISPETYVAKFIVSGANPEGETSFAIAFTTQGVSGSSGVAGALVTETTDDIITVIIDKSPPIYSLNYYYVNNGEKNYFNEGEYVPEGMVINFDIESNEPIYEELYANYQSGPYKDKMLPVQTGTFYQDKVGYQSWRSVFPNVNTPVSIQTTGKNFIAGTGFNENNSDPVIYMGYSDLTNGFRLYYHDWNTWATSQFVELNDINTITHPAGSMHDLAGNAADETTFSLRTSPSVSGFFDYSGIPEELTLCENQLSLPPSLQHSITVQLNSIPTVSYGTLSNIIWEKSTDPGSVENWETIKTIPYTSDLSSASINFNSELGLSLDTDFYIRLRLAYISTNSSWNNRIRYNKVTNSFKTKIITSPIIQGDAFICGIGNTVQLNQTATITSTEDLWSSSDNNIATVDSNGLVTAVGEGEASILYQSSLCETTHQIVIYDLAEPTIAANGNVVEVCEGESVVLTASNFNQALWYKDGFPISDYSTLSLSKVIDSGTYVVKKTTPCGTIISNSIDVIIKQTVNTTNLQQEN